jgi:hypothetical protein
MKTVARFFWLGAFFVLCAGTCDAQVIGHTFFKKPKHAASVYSATKGLPRV